MAMLQQLASMAADLVGRDSTVVRKVRPGYEAILDWASLKRGIRWDINGVEYRIDPHFRHQLGHNYEAKLAAYLGEVVRPGWLCLDIGANVGIYALQLAHWSRPDGRVIAFEPNAGTRTVLEKHIQLNGLSARVRAEPFAICEQSQTSATFFQAGTDGMSRLGAPNQQLGAMASARDVETLTLDDYCEARELRPNLLLMDIEGFEIAALSSARRLIKSRGRDMEIIVEMHPNVWASANTTRAKAESLLQELGLHAEAMTGQDDPLGDYGTVRLICR